MATVENKPSVYRTLCQGLLAVAIGAFCLDASALEPIEYADVQAMGDETMLDVRSVIQYALAKNLDIAYSGTQVDVAKGEHLQSIANLLPSVNGQFSMERFVGGEVFFGATPVSLDRTTYRPTVSLEHEIHTGGGTIYQIKATKNRVLGVKDTQDRTVQQVLLDALSRYYEWLNDIAQLALANKSLSEAQEQVRVNKIRLKTGFGTDFEVLQSKSQEATAEGGVLQAQNEEAIAQYQMISVLNFPISTTLTPKFQEFTPVNYVEATMTLEEMFNVALAARPDLLALDKRIKEARARYGQARSDLFPVLSFSGYVRGIGADMGDLSRTSQGFYVADVDLLRNMGMNVAGRMKAEKARIKQSILEKERQVNAIKDTLAQAYYRWKFFEGQLGVTRKKVEAAKEAFRLAKARLKANVGINLEVIQAEADMVQAQSEYQNTIKNYNVSQLQLMYEMGVLTPDNVLNQVSRFAP